jgi:hypothetical protein
MECQLTSSVADPIAELKVDPDSDESTRSTCCVSTDAVEQETALNSKSISPKSLDDPLLRNQEILFLVEIQYRDRQFTPIFPDLTRAKIPQAKDVAECEL